MLAASRAISADFSCSPRLLSSHDSFSISLTASASDADSGVAGYTFEVQCFGFGHMNLPYRPPVSTTLRSFIATPFDIHMGLQPFDPTTLTSQGDYQLPRTYRVSVGVRF